MSTRSSITGRYEHPDGWTRLVQHESGSLYLLTPITVDTVHTDHVHTIRGHQRARAYVNALTDHGFVKVG